VRAAFILPPLALLAIVSGLLLRATHRGPWSFRVMLGALAILGVPLAWRTIRGALRGEFATDLVAALAIVGALLLGEPLAGLVVVLMQTGGEALERAAERRASEAVRALEESAPRVAHLLHGPQVVDVAADDVAVGDLLLVRPGELVPCDAEVTDGRSHVDASRLTGEPVPVSASPGTRLMSGSVNGEGALTVRALARAGESQYARIVELVRHAQSAKAPVQRLADRYAAWFTPVTLLACLVTWLVSRDATRVLAVLVVATPCPLILATPVAVIGGIARAARRLIIVRTGGALEQAARVNVAVFDKTGTLTAGRPRVSRVLIAPGVTGHDALALIAGVEQRSSHLLARMIVDAARERGIALPASEGVRETPGRGVVGRVHGRLVAVGSRSFVLEQAPDVAPALAALEPIGDGLRAYAVADGRPLAILEFADSLRPGLDAMFAQLRALGIRRTLLLSGDHEANTRAVGEALGLEEVRGDLLASDKARIVAELERGGAHVLMVGDGTNDAPALTAATLGVAMAGSGGVTAEAADAVILADDPARVPELVAIGRDTLRIARQSIWAGMSLSAIAMVAAALGHVPPTVGALLQEVIDVAVILNALRTRGHG
jgi:heavy metal translocating P-type ATPase